MSSVDEMLEQLLTPERQKRIETVLDARTESLTVVLDHVKNAHNISAVIRSCDAFGITRVHLVGEKFEYSRGIALGTEQWVLQEKHETAAQAISELKKRNHKIVILQPKEKNGEASRSVIDLPFNEPLALVFGNEKNGVCKEFHDVVDYYAHIPMSGFVDSFNISVAAAICLFSSTLSQAKHTAHAHPLPEQSRKDIKSKWLTKRTKRADIVVKEFEKRSSQE